MVMTFVLHHLSHYNSIIESRTRFLLSLIEDLAIDFPSHFILSLSSMSIEIRQPMISLSFLLLS